MIGVGPDSSMESSVATTWSTSQKCAHLWFSSSDWISLKHNIEHMLTITWMLLQQLHVVNLSPPNPKNISANLLEFSMRFIQHPIGSENCPRTYGGSEQWVWKSGRESWESPKPPLPLHLQCHVICSTRNGRRSTNLRTFRPPKGFPFEEAQQN